MTDTVARSANRISAGEEQQPWQWPEARWRGIVEHVRAGRPLRPSAWKNGARCAVARAFASDQESGELREAGTSPGRLPQGQYGARVAAPRLLKLLGKYAVPASFFVPAVIAQLYPDEQRGVVGEGHEI